MYNISSFGTDWKTNMTTMGKLWFLIDWDLFILFPESARPNELLLCMIVKGTKTW